MVVKGTYRDGLVELNQKVDCPNGTPVKVVIESDMPEMMREEDFPTTPEGIEALARAVESFDPVEFSPEDEAEIAAARAAVREVTLAAVRRKMGLEP
jgi:predicted DNA-binding antitoxin AbrB/MazE fold protein